MSPTKILLVDGYNVIHSIPELKPGSAGELESARLKLALLVSAWGHGHPAAECVIVFDGDQRFAGLRDQRLAGIRCLFSRASHGGDAEIIRFVREYRGNKADITVVSDDNSVRNSCQAHGADVRPSSFIPVGKARPSPAPSKAPADGKGLDRKSAAAIDRELKEKFGL